MFLWGGGAAPTGVHFESTPHHVPPLFFSVFILYLPCHVTPASFIKSSLHFLAGLPLCLFPPIGYHPNTFFAHISFRNLTKCHAYLHFSFLVILPTSLAPVRFQLFVIICNFNTPHLFLFISRCVVFILSGWYLVIALVFVPHVSRIHKDTLSTNQWCYHNFLKQP